MYDDLKKYGKPWVRKDVRHEFYPRFENESSESWIDSKGVRQARNLYFHMWSDAFDAERRLASETRQNLPSTCKEKVYLTVCWITHLFKVINDATALLYCLSHGTLCSDLGEDRFHVTVESFARAMHERVVDTMFAGRDIFARFTSMRPAGGFAPDAVRGKEPSMIN